MARPKKTTDYIDLYKDLSLEELKILSTEVSSAIKSEERKGKKLNAEKNAMKQRDKMKILGKIKFKVGSETVEGTVQAIMVDKVQVEVDGRKRSISYTKVQSV